MAYLGEKESVLLLIIDGLGDVAIPSFGDRTPLEVAHTPNLDAIAGEYSERTALLIWYLSALLYHDQCI